MDMTPRAEGMVVSARRPRDRERTREEILAVALEEFSEHGLSGGNTDAIAARAGITKRMIFYYFHTKEELFATVLEQAYGKMRSAELALNLDELPPEAAIRRLAAFTFDFDNANPEFVRLVLIENIHRGRHLRTSARARDLTQPIIDQIARILRRGEAAGVIRPGVDPVELHMTLSSLCWFSVANRHTFGALFDRDLNSDAAKARRRAEIADILWRHIRAER